MADCLFCEIKKKKLPTFVESATVYRHAAHCIRGPIGAEIFITVRSGPVFVTTSHRLPSRDVSHRPKRLDANPATGRLELLWSDNHVDRVHNVWV